jgi:hypothetical protein
MYHGAVVVSVLKMADKGNLSRFRALFGALAAVAARGYVDVPSADANLTLLGANVLANVLLPNASDAFALSALSAVDGEVPPLVTRLNATGLFPDIDYSDSDDRSEWQAATHLQRCLMLATAANPAPANPSRHRGNETIGLAADACLGGWLHGGFTNTK